MICNILRTQLCAMSPYLTHTSNIATPTCDQIPNPHNHCSVTLAIVPRHQENYKTVIAVVVILIAIVVSSSSIGVVLITILRRLAYKLVRAHHLPANILP